MGVDVTIVDRDLDRLEYLEGMFLGRAQTLYASTHGIAKQCGRADLVIGAVLVVGARARKLVTRECIACMESGSVIVDVAVDQGGCVDTSRATTHETPTFVVDGIVHYGVANMPGAVARTGTNALSHATSPYLMKLADMGVAEACRADEGLSKGVNAHAGHVTHRTVADAHGLEHVPLARLLRPGKEPNSPVRA